MIDIFSAQQPGEEILPNLRSRRHRQTCRRKFHPVGHQGRRHRHRHHLELRPRLGLHEKLFAGLQFQVKRC